MNLISNFKLPPKSVFKLDEVSQITDVKPYVLRFWETKFVDISPITSTTGQKLYSPKDVHTIMKIKHLIFDQKMTVEDAVDVILGKVPFEKTSAPSMTVAKGTKIIKESVEILLDEIKPTVLTSSCIDKKIDDKYIQRLILAKAKLNSLIALTKSVQEKYNWL